MSEPFTGEFVGQVDSIYELLEDLGAWEDYTVPGTTNAPDGSEYKGASNSRKYSLKTGDLIKVTEIVRRIRDGYQTHKAYEVVKGQVLKLDGQDCGDTSQYYFWIIYESSIYVRLHQPVEDPPPPPPPSDEPPPDQPPGEEPPPDEPPPDQPPGEEPPAPPPPPEGVQIEVKAGQTVVLDIKSDARGTVETRTGSFEINLVDTNNNPISVGPVYLTAPGSTFEIQIDENGHGRLDNIPAGTYTVSLQRPERTDDSTDSDSGMTKLPHVIYFDDSADLPANAGNILDEVVEYISQANRQQPVTKIECRGFTDNAGSDIYNENLRLRRAIAVKNTLSEKLNNAGLSTIQQTTATGRDEVAQNDAERRRVEIWFDPEVIIRRLLAPFKRILVLGDSWAKRIWSCPRDYGGGEPLRQALGFIDRLLNIIVGENTAIGSTSAELWLREQPDRRNRSALDRASLQTIDDELNRYTNIDIVHLSLGGNDFWHEITHNRNIRIYNIMKFLNHDVNREYLTQNFAYLLNNNFRDALRRLNEEPDDRLAALFDKAERNRKQYYSNTFTREEDIELKNLVNVFISDSLPAIVSKITSNVGRIIKHIENRRKRGRNIRICIAGYTKLFLYPINGIVREPPILDTSNYRSDYFYAWGGVEPNRFNNDILSVFDRGMQNLATSFGNWVVYISFFRRYPGPDRPDTLPPLIRDGFHLFCSGYREIANRCVNECYRRWLRNPR
jgi:outer membrane protein OmpA-like peptidoglycan-associated protein